MSYLNGVYDLLDRRRALQQGCSKCGRVTMLTLRDGVLYCGTHDPRWTR